MPGQSAEAARNKAAGQRRIRRLCTCGRIIAGNPGWWSHTHKPNGDKKPEHRYNGRA